jgi:D-alanyl-D-alanine carboxypeptidase (penicillin-binding protein 5/6)
MSTQDETENAVESSTTHIDEAHVEPILENPTPGHVPVLRQLGIAFLLLIFVFSTSYVGTLMAVLSPTETTPDVSVSATLAESTETVPYTNPFNDARVAARSAFVWDVKAQRVLFNKNADQVLPLASITKLMTALVAYELLDDDTAINISVDAIRTDGDSGLKDGESFSLKSLTDMVLVASSNDGAVALGAAAGAAIGGSASPEKIFVEAMNIRARELGLTNTVFKNTTGLDLSPTEAGAYSTARDVALLLEYIITTYPHVASLTTTPNTRVFNTAGEYHDVENTNAIVSEIDGLLASKTGYTELAGGNLAVAFESGLNRPIVVVALGSTYNERFTDVLSLSERARMFVSHESK